jgi:hypothetical protein
VKPLTATEGVGGESRSDEKGSTIAPSATAKPNTLLGEQVKPATRDYAGYTPEEVQALKQMSNPAYEFTAKIIKQNKELAKGAKDVYLQNPNAYMLDPEFNSLQQDLHFIDKEAKILYQQLLNVKDGKPFKVLTDFDSKTGEPIYHPNELEPTAEAEIRLQQSLHDISQLAAQKRGALAQHQQNYTQRIASDRQAIQQVQAQKFAWVADPKLLESKITIPEVGEMTLGKIKSDFLTMLPSYHRGNDLADIAANMFVGLQIYGHQLRELQAGKEKAEFAKEEILRAEPSSTKRIPTERKNNASSQGWAKDFSGALPEGL